MRSAFGKPQRTCACVDIGQVLLSIHCKGNKGIHAQEAFTEPNSSSLVGKRLLWAGNGRTKCSLCSYPPSVLQEHAHYVVILLVSCKNMLMFCKAFTCFFVPWSWTSICRHSFNAVCFLYTTKGVNRFPSVYICWAGRRKMCLVKLLRLLTLPATSTWQSLVGRMLLLIGMYFSQKSECCYFFSCYIGVMATTSLWLCIVLQNISKGSHGPMLLFWLCCLFCTYIAQIVQMCLWFEVCQFVWLVNWFEFCFLQNCIIVVLCLK